MTWKKRLQTCFGDQDLKFGLHHSDQENAHDMFNEARDAGATVTDIIEAARAFLTEKHCLPGHIDEQLKRINDMWFEKKR